MGVFGYLPRFKGPCFTQCLSDHTLRLVASGDQLRELEGLLAVVDRKTEGWQGEGSASHILWRQKRMELVGEKGRALPEFVQSAVQMLLVSTQGSSQSQKSTAPKRD